MNDLQECQGHESQGKTEAQSQAGEKTKGKIIIICNMVSWVESGT